MQMNVNLRAIRRKRITFEMPEAIAIYEHR